MKRFLRRAMAVGVAGAAAAGAAVLPMSTAHADGDWLPCPRVFAVCTWTEPNGGGPLSVLPNERPFFPPVRSVQNQTAYPWCFYSEPGYHGERRRAVQPGETVRDLDFPALSAKPGDCE